jgi:hypothetical protein
MGKVSTELITIDSITKTIRYKYHKIQIMPLEEILSKLLEHTDKGHKVMSLKITSKISLLNEFNN